MSEFITIKEAAKLANKTESSVYRWAKKLPASDVKKGRPFSVLKNVFVTYYGIKNRNTSEKYIIKNKTLIINELESDVKIKS